ncbi:hypothetical protein GFY24_00850 [Nocardia sp. SYP-A9097]|uniref:hypothetical protein n=1 Tax=Nocardia sp. SYP-A9097 TaxID=2663237 RepID=UPI00129BE980|nr:hypothetical protein [Nocardia sp. SYP-A9097]MRH86026.1 hypothetical protein [Nocardia sp. SYP-A9097]
MNAIYSAGPWPYELTLVCQLPDTTTADLATRRTGSRDYLAGTITTDADTTRALLQENDPKTQWVQWDSVYLRIQVVALAARGRGIITVDQSMPALSATQPGGGRIAVRLVEPSPPQATADWVPAERERAVADYYAEQQAGRHI